MGLGSRWSKYINNNLLSKFIYIELALSLLVSFSSLIAYTTAAFSSYIGLIIYSLSILIGVLIGLEIPLVIRINKEFESLKVNIASVMEKDYWGSLVGGVFFAFVGLPYLGLTYTPFILGAINFSVALILLFTVREDLKLKKRVLWMSSSATAILIFTGFFFAKPIVLFGEQKRYTDKVVYSEQSKYQRLVITEWKDDYWLYIDGNQQFSTVDEDKYHEPLVHPVMQLAQKHKHILILGGGDGCAVREVLKYPDVEKITLVDLDPAMTNLGKDNSIIKTINEGAMDNEKLTILNQDGFQFLEKTPDYFDVIIIDLPDPKSVDLNRLYSKEFYTLCGRQLRPNGIIVTQAGSPYFATKAFQCIDVTMAAAGFETAMLHNHVITLGEWGWVVGAKNFPKGKLKQALNSLSFEDVDTRWINHEAMALMTSFGKDIYFTDGETIEVNTIHNPSLYHYYLNGNWDLY